MRIDRIKAKITTFIKEEQGLTTVEYAVAGGIVGVALVAAFPTLGRAVAAEIFRMSLLLEQM